MWLLLQHKENLSCGKWANDACLRYCCDSWCLSSPMPCFLHSSIKGNAFALCMLRVTKSSIAGFHLIRRHIKLSGLAFLIFNKCLFLLLPLVVSCPDLHRCIWDVLGCCSHGCSNRWGVHGLWAAALGIASSWAGKEKETFMSLQITFRSIRGSQGK